MTRRFGTESPSAGMTGMTKRSSDTRVRIGRIVVDPLSLQDASDAIITRAEERSGASVHLANAYTVAIAEKDETFAECVNQGWLNLADGRPLQWISRLRKDDPALRQIRGIDLLKKVVSDGQSQGLSHYFLGSTEEVRSRMTERLQSRFGKIVVAGSESPPFRELTPEESADQATRLRMSGAKVVWVSLGTPKQDAEIERLSHELDAVCIGIGAGFALAAGHQWDVPTWVSVLGLEWLSRLAQEPARLWRRYLGGNLIFIGVALRDLSSKGRRPR